MRPMTRARFGGMFSAVAGVALLVATTTLVTGCRMPDQTRARAADQATGLASTQIDFWLEPSRREALTGETVTLTVRDQDTAGRDVRIEWTTTGGELTTERNNRIARVQFDTPGVFTVTSRMYVDDLVFSDTVDITVQRVR